MSNQTQAVKFKKPTARGENEVYVKLNPPAEGKELANNQLWLQAGSVIEGYLSGQRTTDTIYGARNEFLIKSLDGTKTYVVPKVGNLAYRLSSEGIEEGSAVQLTYNGKSKIEKGTRSGTMSHDFTVAGEEV